MIISFAFSAVIVILKAIAVSSFKPPVVVGTEYGDIIGFYDKETNGKTFLGIPYAKPPVGDLRFRPPQPVDSWAPQVRIANSFASSCIQTNNTTVSSEAEPIENQSEDCLYLNIFTPNKEANENSLLPVFIWFHGGYFRAGSSRKAYSYGNKLSNHGKIIVISVNYRIGLLGFLTLEELDKEDPNFLTSGNYGLLDQNLALKWVKNNVKYFGGDPNNISIGGESAGANSVCFHLFMPISNGLFNKAIMESGSCFFPQLNKNPFILSPSLDAQLWKRIGLTYMSALQCGDSRCLRKLEAAAIRNFQSQYRNFVILPIIDGLVIPDDPLNLILQGKFNKADVIFGTNTDEGTLFSDSVPLHEISENEYIEIMPSLFRNTSDIMAFYPTKHYSTPRKALVNAFTDFAFLCMGRQMLRYLQSNGVLAYQYQFNHVPSYLNETEKSLFGASHTAEINFVFNQGGDNVLNHKPFKFTEAEKKLSFQIQNFWIKFIHSTHMENSGISWKPYNNTDMPYLFLDEYNIEIRNNYKKLNCDFYDSFVPMEKNFSTLPNIGEIFS